MNKINKITIVFALLILSSTCYAQKWREYVSGEVCCVSRYIYRGMDVEKGTAFANLIFNYKGLKAAAEYGIAFSGDYQELVLSLGYNYKDFTLSVRDQYFPIYEGVRSVGFSNWDPEVTSHQLEVVLKYEPKKIPIQLLWSTFVAGYDLKYEFDAEGNFYWGNRAYSSYFEATAYHKFPKMHVISATTGFSVNKGMYTVYKEDFAFVNAQVSYSKTWVLKGVYPSIGAYLVYNQHRDKFYPVAYASVSF